MVKIEQLSDGRWYGTWQIGKRQRRIHSTNRQQLEEQAIKEMHEWKQKGITPDAFKRSTDFGTVCDLYFAEHVIDGDVVNKTAVKSTISLFKGFFANRNIRDIDTDMVEKAMKKYVRSTHTRLTGQILPDGKPEKIKVQNSPSSAKKKFGLLRAIFNWAIKKGYLQLNPCKAAEKYEEDDTFPRFLDKAEITRLLTDAPKRFFDYCFLILHTGMRPSEALNLSWTDIDLWPFFDIKKNSGGLVYFVRRKKAATGLRQKNNKKDTIPVDAPLHRWLQARRKEGEQGLVLNYTLQQLRDDGEAAIQASGINSVSKPGTSKFTIYGLRHTYASHLLMAGEKIETVAKILRHADINITYKHYGHLVDQYKAEAMAKMNLLDAPVELKVVG